MTIEKFKYIKNISDAEGTILIYKQIGNSIDEFGNTVYGVNGSDFANEMQYLQKVCDKITVRINSIGGNVLDGYSIASSILNSSKPVRTVIDGLAASTAGWCAACGNVGMRDIIDYGSLMTHGSSGTEDKQMSDFIDSTINTVLSNRSGKTTEEIANMMKKETWMNATQAKEHGFVDNVISSGKSKVKIPKNTSAEAMLTIYNKLINKPNMEKIQSILKLSNTADENEVVKAIETEQTKISDLEKKNSELEAELKGIKDDANKSLEDNSKELVKKASDEKLIEESEVAGLEKLAVADFKAVENMLNKLRTNKASSLVSKKPFDAKNIKENGNTDDRSVWTIMDWQKKDPKSLGDMQNNTPLAYETLYNNYYKK